MAIHGEDFIPHHEPRLPFQLEAVGQLGDHRHPHLGHSHIQHQDDDQAHEKVHKGTGAQDDNLFPGGLDAEGSLVPGVLVLPFHGAVAADGEGPQGVLGLATGTAPQRRTHTDGKFIHSDSQ